MRKYILSCILVSNGFLFFLYAYYFETNNFGFSISKYFTLQDNRPYSPRIFCIIPTHPDYFPRVKAVHEAWATKCDMYKFITVIPDKWLNISKVSVDNETKLNGFEFEFQKINFLQPVNFTFDVYNKLTDKLYKTFKYLYKNYNDYDFYLKSDDDAFIFVDNLRKFLSRQNRTMPVTYGWDLSCMGGYHSGGN
jgi:hypothetical protein